MSELLIVRARFSAVRRPRGISDRDWADVLTQLWERWLSTGELPEGFEISIEWQNPDNRNQQHRDWKEAIVTGGPDADQGAAHDARITLNRGNWLVGKLTFGGMGFEGDE